VPGASKGSHESRTDHHLAVRLLILQNSLLIRRKEKDDKGKKIMNALVLIVVVP